MTHHVVVVWHDDGIDNLGRRKSAMVKVRERPSEADYFLGGLLNQAMRQYGYTEEHIHAQAYVGPVEFHWPAKNPKIKKICGECGSEDVCIDAWSTWDEVTQRWVLGPIFEDCFCNGCEQQCDIIDEEIKP